MTKEVNAGGMSQTLLGMIVGAIVIVLVAAIYVSGVFSPSPDVSEVAVPQAAEQEAPATATQDATETEEPIQQDSAAPAENATEDPVQEVVEIPATEPLKSPALDVVRVEPDGSALVAGKAEPGSTVIVMMDGKENMRLEADASGDFVAFLTLPPSDTARVLSLVGALGDEVTAASDQVILAPIKAAEPQEDANQQLALLSEPSTGAAASEAEAPSDVTPTEPLQPAAASEPLQTDTAVDQPQADAVPVKEPEVETATANAEQAAQEVAPTQTTDAETVESTETADTANEPSEPNQTDRVAVLRADDSGVELLSSSAPEVMSTVELDTISYSGTGDVQLSGRAPQGDGFVRIYLDNAAIASLPVDKEGRWRGDLPDVDTGIYTLRIDQVSTEGKVTSRVETPFKREEPEVLTAALEQTKEAPVRAVTVQKGATLWAIARETYGDGLLYVRVFDANKSSIRDPDLIYPGQVFALPE